MRIISKFNDYYDSVQAYGQDEKCVYMRKSEEHVITEERLDESLSELFKAMPDVMDSLRGTKHIIGFCGKLYPVWGLSHSPKDLRGYPFGSPAKFEDFAYEPEDVRQFCVKHRELKETLKTFNKKLKKQIYYWRSQKFRAESLVEATEILHKSTKLDKLFWDYRIPCFVFSGSHRYNYGKSKFTFTTNPNLAKYKFYKIKDTVTAYQDINQYISGILGLNDKEIVHISDKDMKSQKGFYEYSFKTLPTKKR